MSTHILCFRAKKNINFHLKMNIFTAVKYCCIVHGCVCVMSSTKTLKQRQGEGDRQTDRDANRKTDSQK